MSVPTALNIIDLFCGGGGTSEGLHRAAREMGLNVHALAANHNQLAIDTYKRNHPGADARCARVETLHIKELYRSRRAHLVWGSPECTNHSQAKGDLSLDDQSRSTAMAVIDVVTDARPDVLYVENVSGFLNWCPLEVRIGRRGRQVWRPIASRRGETFQAWIGLLRSLGYLVEYRKLVAANYGDPTTRERLIIQAVLPHIGMDWPEPTHGPPVDPLVVAGKRLPWRTAASVIDWSDLGTSIFDRRRPLVWNTIRRILSGLRRSRPVDSAAAIGSAMVTLRGTSERALLATGRSVDGPVPTVTAQGGHHALVNAVVIPQQSAGTAKSAELPVPTVATAGAIAVSSAVVHEVRAATEDDMAFRVFGDIEVDAKGRPLMTDAQYAQFVSGVESFLVKYYGTANDASVDAPLDTVTTRLRFGLINVRARPVMVCDRGRRWSVDLLYRMLKVQELARAQGFPDDYWFAGKQETQVMQIGNAVPVHMACALGKSAFSRILRARAPKLVRT